MKKNKKEIEDKPYKFEMESFRDYRWELRPTPQFNKPSAYNGMVNIK